MNEEYKYTDITDNIIKALYKVYNTLGHGFLERVYENALSIEIRNLGLKVQSQSPVTVYYENEIVGEYVADLVIEDRVIVEVKAVKELAPAHEVQLVNYLKATGIEVGLLVNFGEKLEFRRRVFSKRK